VGGATSATFSITTTPVTATTSTDVVGTYSGVSRSAILTLQPAAVSDIVSITKAEWNGGKLTVEATSNKSSAVLTAYVTATGAKIGTLTGSGGRYKGTFAVASKPASVTVRSSLGGSATKAVR
jgi:hypothetical protein